VEREDGRRQPGHERHRSALAFAFQLWPLPVIAIYDVAAHRDAALMAVALYATATALLRGNALRSQLTSGLDVAAFAALPVSDEWLFRRCWRRLVLQSLPTLVVFAFAAWLSLPPGHEAWRTLAGVAAVVAGWGIVVAVAAVAAAWAGPRAAAAGAVLQLCLVAGCQLAWRIPEQIPGPALFVVALTPGGWILAALQRACGAGDPTGLVWLVVAAAFTATLPAVTRELARWHRVREVMLVSTGFAIAVREDETPLVLARPEEIAVERREVRAPSRGWLDGFVERLLSRRERALVAFLRAGNTGWSVEWKRFAIMNAIIAALCPLLPSGLTVCAGAVDLIWLFFAMVGPWRGFDLRPSGGGISPLVLSYPIGYWEAGRAMLKVNLARLVTLLPFVLIVGTIMIAVLEGSSVAAVVAAGKICFLVLAVQPLLVFFVVSHGSTRVDLPLLLAPVIVGAVIGGVGSARALFSSSWAVSLPGGLVLAAVCLGTAAAYVALYQRGRFDQLGQWGR
jgi:hypothetical protein